MSRNFVVHKRVQIVHDWARANDNDPTVSSLSLSLFCDSKSTMNYNPVTR